VDSGKRYKTIKAGSISKFYKQRINFLLEAFFCLHFLFQINFPETLIKNKSFVGVFGTFAGPIT